MRLRRNLIGRWLRSLGLARASDELVIEQFGIIAKQIPLLYSVIIVNCVFMAMLASGVVSKLLAYTFPVGAIPVMLYRVFAWRNHAARLRGTRDVQGMRKALRATTLMANVLAAILAVWSIAILAKVDPSDASFVPVFTILSMITCAYCLAAYPLAAYSVMLSGSTYIAIAMACTGDHVLIALAANIALVSVMVFYMVGHQYGQLRRVVQTSDKLSRQRAQAKSLAYQDQLTGLPNRRALIAFMERQRVRSVSSELAMIMIDLNGFKPVNDTFGHAAGDKLLVAISRRLRQTIGENGYICRLGGDEFCVILSGIAQPKQAMQIARSINAAIKRPLSLAGHLLHLEAALGVAAGVPLRKDPMELIQYADIALYEAKARGGSAIMLFAEDMEARIRRRTLIEQALSDARNLAAIGLEFQPIFELRSRRLIAYEALARWRHPELGQISPGEFVEVAERSGKARSLTLHLFKLAIAQAVTWPADVRLSFNLSGSGLCSAGFEVLLPAIMEDAGFSPHRLDIEVTETAILPDPAAAWSVLEELQRQGIRIVLDDFGAGFASIGYLRHLKLDGVKLDGGMIREVTTSARSRQLLLGVLRLCQSIGVSVTAEEVETEEQLVALQAFPIDHVQGFLLGRPGKAAHSDFDHSEPARNALRSAV